MTKNYQKLKTCISPFLVLIFCSTIVNGIELGNVRGMINDIKTNKTEIVIPNAIPSVIKDKAFINPKIHVTPITANWSNAMLLKFNQGTDINTVKKVLKETGLESTNFADNSDGFFVRIAIKNNLAPQKALLLARYSVIESVQVNKTVYKNLENGKKAKETGNKELQEVSKIFSSQQLPGTCAVYKNNFHSNYPWDDSLSITITKNGKYIDMLLSSELNRSTKNGKTVFKSELLSTDGPDWLDYHTKDIFELHVNENNKPLYLKMKKYKEVETLFGGKRWKELESMICK